MAPNPKSQNYLFGKFLPNFSSRNQGMRPAESHPEKRKENNQDPADIPGCTFSFPRKRRKVTEWHQPPLPKPQEAEPGQAFPCAPTPGMSGTLRSKAREPCLLSLFSLFSLFFSLFQLKAGSWRSSGRDFPPLPQNMPPIPLFPQIFLGFFGNRKLFPALHTRFPFPEVGMIPMGAGITLDEPARNSHPGPIFPCIVDFS